jgi:hypothetical protein
MAAREELEAFVRDGLGRGTSRAQLEEVLIRAGWDRREVAAALGRFAEIDFPIPVPRPRTSLSAQEAFHYLVVFSTLYVSAYQVGHLVFAFIERAFPDPAAPEWLLQSGREAIRWSVSSLVVAFPIFLYVSRLAERAVRRDPAKRHSKTRRWLTYLTLFVAASVLIGNGIALVNGVLGGELTVRFLLKVLTVALIAGAIFGYYLVDLRRDEDAAEDAA